jgi:hypothetical protein
MNHNPNCDAFNEAGKALSELGIGCSLGLRLADEAIPYDSFTVALKCPGVPFGEVHGHAATPGDALMRAWARREEVLAGQQRMAA